MVEYLRVFRHVGFFRLGWPGTCLYLKDEAHGLAYLDRCAFNWRPGMFFEVKLWKEERQNANG